MKSLRWITVAFIASTLMLSACAKKDSNFAARYAKNKSGAGVVNGAETQAAAEQAAAQGLEADIVGIEKTVNGGVISITSTIMVNNFQQSVRTTHAGTEQVSGPTEINGFQVYFQAMCGDSNCNTYYVMMNISKNNALVIQEGLLKNFVTPALDVYQWFKPQEARTALFNGNAQDEATMVGYLNKKESMILVQ